jgi:hypothetical protein
LGKNEPKINGKQKTFSFIEKDFRSSTGERDGARHLSIRIRELSNDLKKNLGEEFSDWPVKNSKSTEGRNVGGKVTYRKIAWTGFVSPNALGESVQKSIQFQVTFSEKDIHTGIWVSWTAKKEIQKVRQRMIEQKEDIINSLKALPNNFLVIGKIKGEDHVYKYTISEIDDSKVSEIIELLNKKNAEFGIQSYLTPNEAISKGNEIISYIVECITKLLPTYNFLAKINENLSINSPSKTGGNNEFVKYKKLIESKKQVIFYGPPGTGKTFNAEKFAPTLIKYRNKGKQGDEPKSGKKEEWVEYLNKKLMEISPLDYSLDNSEGEEYFSLKSKYDEKRIRVFYGNKEKDSDEVEVGFQKKSMRWISKVPERNRFFLIINLSNHVYALLPYKILKKYAKFRKGEIWDQTGEESMWFTMKNLSEEQVTLRANDNFDKKEYDCKEYLYNLENLLPPKIEFSTFHPSLSYEEFLEGLKVRTDENKQLEYYIDDGIFKRVCHYAENDKNNDNYVLIIDEINRGNVSKIFGELITKLEKDKRESIPVILPYSKERFNVPQNVYIIGTMNTADRSLVQIDIALRRRFGFIEFMPEPSRLDNCGEISLSTLLENLNKLILVNTQNREFQIGHSYFMEKGKSFSKFEQLKFAMETEVIPLLQEYFFNDFNELEKVLGKDFVDTINEKINRFDNDEEFHKAMKFILDYE